MVEIMVSREDIKLEVLGLINKYSRTPYPNLGEETPIQEIEIDSIDLMEIMFHIEEKYGVGIDDNDISDISIVKDVVDISSRYLNSE